MVFRKMLGRMLGRLIVKTHRHIHLYPFELGKAERPKTIDLISSNVFNVINIPA